MAFKRKIKYFYKGRREWINGKFLNRAERFFYCFPEVISEDFIILLYRFLQK
jgi:hypothetical protein